MDMHQIYRVLAQQPFDFWHHYPIEITSITDLLDHNTALARRLTNRRAHWADKRAGDIRRRQRLEEVEDLLGATLEMTPHLNMSHSNRCRGVTHREQPQPATANRCGLSGASIGTAQTSVK